MLENFTLRNSFSLFFSLSDNETVKPIQAQNPADDPKDIMDSEVTFQRLVFTKRRPTGPTSEERLVDRKELEKAEIPPTMGSRTRSKNGHVLFKKQRHKNTNTIAKESEKVFTFEERLEKQNAYDFSETSQPKEPKFPSRPGQDSTKLGDRYKEWGPSINGYRFLDTEEKVDKKCNIPVAEPQDIHRRSSDDASEPFEKHLQTYDEYIENWKKYPKLYWPNEENSWTCVSYDSIKQFLHANQSLLVFKKRLKVERVRWHPDKMKRNIDCDEKVLTLVTETFQLINKLWEDFFRPKYS